MPPIPGALRLPSRTLGPWRRPPPPTPSAPRWTFSWRASSASSATRSTPSGCTAHAPGGSRRATRTPTVHELLVKTGRIPPELHAGAHALLPRSLYALYGPKDHRKPWKRETPESARQAFEAAERFLRAVEELLAAPT